MYYDPIADNHGLPRDPFLALVVPRPIGWITTVDAQGRVNLAPYSFFNAISSEPHLIMFSSGGAKHSQTNAEATGEFVANLATYELREEMNGTSAHVDAGVDEAALVGLEMVPSRVVKPPRVARSPVALECRVTTSLPLYDLNGVRAESTAVIGQVVSIYIDDAVIVDGRVDLKKIRPLSRLGYLDYGVPDTIFRMTRPD